MINRNLKKFIRHIVFDFTIALLCAFLVFSTTLTHGDFAKADTILGDGVEAASVYPYSKTFTISAYYSPLPCQNRYTTGSYDGDIRLNGSGVNGADGTAVYPGMIAAPRTYNFGTKMYIPTIGIVAVHDRGGAILATDGTEGVYDRLDIWMGYGDTGLNRALNWGKRNVDVTVYGIDDSVIEDIYLDGYSADESIVGECAPAEIVVAEYVPEPTTPPEIVIADDPEKVEQVIEEILSNRIDRDLNLGSSGHEVNVLQQELAHLNFYKGPITGYYGEITEHAVLKFQQSQYLVGDETSLGAGVMGTKTRDRMNELIASRDYTILAVAETTKIANDARLAKAQEDLIEDEVVAVSDEILTEVEVVEMVEEIIEENPLLAKELDFGIVGPDVRVLQEFLKEQGFFSGALTTDYFGPMTQEALIEFQITNGVVSSSEDKGAGRVGPSTLDVINSLS